MLTDALSDLIRDVGDDSTPEHKAIFILWSALDDIAHRTSWPTPGDRAERALKSAAAALTATPSPTEDS